MTVISTFAASHIAASGGSLSACAPLTHVQALNLISHCHSDIRGLLYNSCLSVIDAVSGSQSFLYSWATVKLYYSLFYSIKSLLLIRKIGTFYHLQKPGLIEIKPGGVVRQLTRSEAKGGSHGSALRLFENFAPNHILVTSVGHNPSLEWIKRLREDVNYNFPRFLDPQPPVWFAKSIGSNSVRKVLASYTSDPNIYAFDPDHAALALPLLAARIAIVEAKTIGVEIDLSDQSFLVQCARDSSGTLTNLTTFLSLS